MFGLLSSLANTFWVERHPPYRVVFLGLKGSGKSTLVRAIRKRLAGEVPSSNAHPVAAVAQRWVAEPVHPGSNGSVDGQRERYIPTVGLDRFSVTSAANGPEVTWVLLDLGGDASFRFLWGRYLQQADAVVWVIDGTDATRIEECIAALQETCEHLAPSAAASVAEAGCSRHGIADAGSKHSQPSPKRPLILVINRLHGGQFEDAAPHWEEALTRLIEGVTKKGAVGPVALQHVDALTGYGVHCVVEWLLANRPTLPSA